MLRCYAVDGMRYCNNCGENLGPSTYCPGCGTLYPDYCIVASKKPAQRAFERKEFSLGLSLPGTFGKSSSTTRKQEWQAASRGGATGLRRKLMMVGAGIALLAAIAFGAFLVIQDRAESKFTREFVVALYGVKSGTDQCLKKSVMLANGSRLVDKDLAQLKSVKSEIDAALQVLSPPPEKFRDTYNRLMRLEATYKKLYNLCITSEPTAEVAAAAETLEKQFYDQAKELKVALSPKLLAELSAKASRYDNLQFMLE